MKLIALVGILGLLNNVVGFNLPGIGPRSFKEGEE